MNHLPGYEKMKELCSHNSYIPYSSTKVNYNSSNNTNNNNNLTNNTQSTLFENFNVGTYDTCSLNNQVLKIFEFEESNISKQRKKIEQKKQVPVSNNNKKKEDNSQKQYLKKQTIETSSNFSFITEFNKQSLEKLKLDNTDNITCGYSEYYGELYSFSSNFSKSKVNNLNPVLLLKAPKRRFYSNVACSDDTNIKEIDDYNIYCSDKILASLMTMNFNSRPWHVFIKKIGSKLYFDIDENSGIYYQSIPDNDFEAEYEESSSINHIDNLMVETSNINEYVKQIVLGERIECNTTANYNTYPFETVEGFDNLETTFGGKGHYNNKTDNVNMNTDRENLLYAYREWKIGDEVKVLVRCQIHSGTLHVDEDGDEEIVKMNIYALNEYNVSLVNFLIF
jgi:translation initiation factor 3 subunit D